MKLLFVILVLGMCGLCIFGAVKTILEARGVLTGIASLSWPETTATITKWNVETSLGGPTASTASRAFLTCEYKYLVGGKEYTNDRTASYPLSKSDIFGMGYGLTEGSTHEVFYDPTDPNNSVLLRGWKCWALLIGCAFFIGPFVIIIALWKSRNNILELWKDWLWFELPA
jgi:hypothetical protein